MKTVIIGGGRLGSALARRSVVLGHTTRILGRESHLNSAHSPPPEVTIEAISRAQPDDAEIILLAAPGHADRNREALVEQFLRKLPKEVPVCSAVAYPDAPHTTWAHDRLYLRFICSPAIASPKCQTTIIALNSEARVRTEFARWLGRTDAMFVDVSTFDRLSSLFMATVVHLQTIRLFLDNLNGGPTRQEVQFAASTFREAEELLRLFSYSPASALEACSTPLGLTERIIDRLSTAVGEAKLAS